MNPTRDVPHPVRALDEDELDRLELSLGGGLAPPALPEGTDRLTLTDRENTPLAVVERTPDGVRLTAQRQFARGTGPASDDRFRRPPTAVRGTLPADHEIVAAVVRTLPTRADVRLAVHSASRVRVHMLLLVPVRRRATGGPGADALIRATQGLAAEITEQVPGTSWEIVAVPWSEDGPIPDDVAFAYGAEDVVDLEGRRSDVERTAAASLASRRQALTDKLYPSYSAVELGVAQRADGAVILLTGLSGSGKSTIARALVARLGQEGRNSTLLDGDEVRHHLSRGLGFDRRSRELNVERIGYVASLIAKHGGVAVAAPIAPFASGRAAVRSLAETYGRFLLVHVSTPLDVCEQRDRKGLYARARSGEIPDFTGISSPYETPDDADVAVDSTDRSIDETVDLIIKALSMPASLEPSARRSGAHVGKGGSLEADER